MVALHNRKKKYLDQYQVNEKGEYEYYGTVYKWQMDEISQKHSMNRLKIQALAAVVLSIAAGCIPAPGVNSAIYLLLPYALGIMGAVSILLALWQTETFEGAIPSHIYKAGIAKVPGRSLFTMACTAIAAGGEIFYLVLHGWPSSVLFGLLFCVLELLVFAGNLWSAHYVKGLSWEKIEANEKKKEL